MADLLRHRARVGIAFSDLAENAEALLRNADMAMYKAKASGKGRHALFEPDMHAAEETQRARWVSTTTSAPDTDRRRGCLSCASPDAPR